MIELGSPTYGQIHNFGLLYVILVVEFFIEIDGLVGSSHLVGSVCGKFLQNG